MDQVFIDGVDNFSLISGIIRLNTVVNTGKAAEDSTDPNQPKFLGSAGPQIVMTPETFARIYAGFKKMHDELTSRGVIKPVENLEIETTRAMNSEIAFD